MTNPTIAVLGMGNMGAPIARRLCEAGYRVHVWNRTLLKAIKLEEVGAFVFEQAASAVKNADFVIGVLENGAVVAEVLKSGGVLAGMQAGALYIEMASILPSEARLHASWCAAKGARYIDAPVSGGTLGAESGTLAIMVGGEAQDFAQACERASSPLAHLGRCTHVGSVGSGQLAKLVNQMIVGITIGAVAEGLILAEAGGANPAKVREAISGGFAQSRVLEVHGQRMVEHDFVPRARLAIQLKDMKNAEAAAFDLDTKLPITTLLTSLYQSACDNGFADLDQAGLIQALNKSG